MIDIGVVFVENIIRHMEMENRQAERKALLIDQAERERGSRPILTAALTTVVSSLPVFFLEAQRKTIWSTCIYQDLRLIAARAWHCRNPHAGLLHPFSEGHFQKVHFSNILLAVVGIGMTVYTGQFLY